MPLQSCKIECMFKTPFCNLVTFEFVVYYLVIIKWLISLRQLGFSVVLARMDKIVLYIVVIKRSVAAKTTMHYHLYIPSQLRTRLLAITTLINKEAFHVSFELCMKDCFVFNEMVQQSATHDFSVTQNLRETVC